MFLAFFGVIPRLFKSIERLSTDAVTNILSPSCKTKSPLGASASPFLITAQTSTLHFVCVGSALKGMLQSLLSLLTRSSTISTRPLAKVSCFKNPGYLRSFSMALDACFSGFTVMDSAYISRIS